VGNFVGHLVYGSQTLSKKELLLLPIFPLLDSGILSMETPNTNSPIDVILKNSLTVLGECVRIEPNRSGTQVSCSFEVRGKVFYLIPLSFI